MAEWLDLEHTGHWTRIESKRNAIAFEHPQTGEEMRVLRRVFPKGTGSDYRYSYCIRYISPDGDDWTDVFTTRDRSKIEPVLRESMARLDAAYVHPFVLDYSQALE